MVRQAATLTKLQELILFVTTLSCLALLLGLSYGLLPPQGDVLANENRRVAPFPSLSSVKDWQGFPQAFETYFADRLAFRQTLTTAHHQVLIKLFHASPTRKVLLGQDGWLFLQGPGGNAVDLFHRNIKPFSGQEIQDVRAELVRRRDWVASWGGRALFVLIPNKETIYPEHLPELYQRQANSGSRYAQWETIFSKENSLDRIDLKPALLIAKQQGQVYFRSDSHWNADGAYVGYRELVKGLRLWFPKISQVERRQKAAPKTYQGDLARLLAVGNWFDELDLSCSSTLQEAPRLQCAKPVDPISEGRLIPKKSNPLVFECGNAELPTAVLVRDSMSIPWLAWLPDNFRRLFLSRI